MNYRSDVVVDLIDHMGSDDSVVKAMLVSTKGEDSVDAEATRGRINFLMRERHLSPFEHGSLTFFIKAPLAIVVQLERHRTFAFNEESARYRELNDEFYLPGDDRPLCQTGKVGEYQFVQGTKNQMDSTRNRMRKVYECAITEYSKLLAQGVAKEVARFVLPVGIYKSLYVTMNPRNLMHFLSLRTQDERSMFPSHPQYEIELMAKQMETFFKQHYPLTYAAWTDHGRYV